jgi:hypothetical protein
MNILSTVTLPSHSVSFKFRKFNVAIMLLLHNTVYFQMSPLVPMYLLHPPPPNLTFNPKLGVVAHIYNPSTWEAEARELRPAWAT